MSVAPGIVAYHRSVLSKFYFDNLNPPSDSDRRKRSTAEVEEIRQRDAVAFEKARQSLAYMLKVPYRAGYTIPAARGDQAGSSSDRWVTGIPSDSQVGDCLAPILPSQTTQVAPETGLTALPLIDFSYKAYMNTQDLYETRVFQKMDQLFEEFATPFERGFSVLCGRRERPFYPILDNNYTVVGHTGKVAGGREIAGTSYAVLAIPEKYEHQKSIYEASLSGIPVFVTSMAHMPDGWKAMGGYTTEDAIEVRTTVDGEVTDYKSRSVGGLEEPWYSPMDFICIGEVLVNLGAKLGAKLAKTLVKRITVKLEARAVFEGATRKLAIEVEKSEAELARRAAQHPRPPGSSAAKAASKEAAHAQADLARKAKAHPKPPNKGLPAPEAPGAWAAREAAGADAAAKTVAETELKPFPHKRSVGRTISRPEMAALVRKAIQSRPWLMRLSAIGRSANSGAEEAMKILREWANATGKTFMRVTDGTVERLRSMGGGGWAIDPRTGKEVLILDDSLFRSPDGFVTEVIHELCYEAVREPTGVPKLITGEEVNSNVWLERVVTEGERWYSFLE